MLDSITQEEPFGCAISCVAFRLNLSYSDAKGLFKHPEYSSRRGYYCDDIVEALDNGGCEGYTFAQVDDDNRKFLDVSGTIVLIRRNVKYPAGHWLIRSGDKWVNPWINFPCMKPAKSGFQKELQ